MPLTEITLAPCCLLYFSLYYNFRKMFPYNFSEFNKSPVFYNCRNLVAKIQSGSRGFAEVYYLPPTRV